jgi:hypothetical protein
MSEIKFACPSCQQHIQADAGYAGMQIDCPACKAKMIVPGTRPAPMAAPPAPIPVPVPISAAATAYAPPPPSSAPAAGACPSCGGALPRGAVLCTVCGYNLATRQRTVAGRPAALGRPTAAAPEAVWYKTPYPYLGLLMVVLGLLYWLGQTNPFMKLAFIGVAALYTFGMHIMVAISAFRESAGTGLMALCIPFYAVYYVFKVSEDQTLQLLYGVAFLLNIILRFIT